MCPKKKSLVLSVIKAEVEEIFIKRRDPLISTFQISCENTRDIMDEFVKQCKGILHLAHA